MTQDGEEKTEARSASSPASAQNVSTQNVIVRFVDWIKPYKEFAVIAAAGIAFLSGGVSWAVSHFATVEQLSHLECRMSVNISIQSLPIQSSMTSMKIEGKWSQIAYLSRENTPDSQVKQEQLRLEIKDLGDERKRIDAAFQQEVAAAPIKCARTK
jgi:hypothetical protein